MWFGLDPVSSGQSVFLPRSPSAADAGHRHTGKNARYSHGQIADHWHVTDADINGAENEQRPSGNIGRGQRFVDHLGQKDIVGAIARETLRRIRTRMLTCGKWVRIVIHKDIPPR